MDRSQPAHAVSVTGLCKTFGGRTVLDGVDLQVPAGTVFALLGANGAGKTTTVRVLSTLLPFDSGVVEVAGHSLPSDARAVRADISVTGQYASVDKLLTGRENLVLMGELHHLGRRESRRRADELLHTFDLVDAAGRRADTYSGGMRRRLAARDEPGRAAEGAVPGRTDHGTGPAQPPGHVGHGPATGAQGHHDRAHHPVPRRGGRACRPDRRARRRPDRRRGHRGRAETTRPRRTPRGAPPRPRSGDPELSVESFTLHTPDLDDVFFALTGSALEEEVR